MGGGVVKGGGGGKGLGGRGDSDRLSSASSIPEYAIHSNQ